MSQNIKLKLNAIMRLMRITTPAPYILLFAPIFWAIAFAIESTSMLIYCSIVFSLEVIIMRSIGCIINDILDRNIDIKTERTKNRPLASGELTVKDAVITIAILGLLAFAIGLFLPPKTLELAIIAVPPSIIIYPLSKRFTNYPQIILGFVFNIGVPIAWFAINGTLNFIIGMIYLSAICWTTGYDIIYAHRDYYDDLKNKVGSMACIFGRNIPDVVWFFYRISILSILIAAIQIHANIWFYFIMLPAFYLLYWQTDSFDFTDQNKSAQLFNSNIWYAIISIIACIFI